MPAAIHDFRSDTVTRPTPGMRAAMNAAELGDDVMGDDPTINRLQEYAAALVGKEAALIVPSGTMSNQIAIRLHCRPGDELVCDAECHIYNYEQGGAAQLSGVSTRCIGNEYGVIKVEQLEGIRRPENDHLVRTKLLTLENTHNRGGGRVTPYETVVELCAAARAVGLKTHLDGARLFNAVVKTGVSAAKWAKNFDTISMCMSKGLGAPVGSILAGPKDLIVEAKRHRKLFGGGMRQAGVLAAAMQYALEHHVERMAEDHENAALIAEAIRDVEGLELRPKQPETNIIIFRVDPQLATAAQFVARLQEKGVLTLAISGQNVRICTHLDVDRAAAQAAGRAIREVVDDCRSGVESVAAAGASYAG